MSVPAVTLFTTGAVDLSIAHSNGIADVRVKRGTVVGFRAGPMYGSFIRAGQKVRFKYRGWR